MIIFCADKKGDCSLVEASSLPIPLFDRVEGALPRKVEHEEDSYCIVAYKGQHVDELALASKIPDREGNLGVPYRNGFLHEINTL